jgi:hypothetical protein
VVLLVGLNSKRRLCIVCKNAVSDEVWNRVKAIAPPIWQFAKSSEIEHRKFAVIRTA